MRQTLILLACGCLFLALSGCAADDGPGAGQVTVKKPADQVDADKVAAQAREQAARVTEAMNRDDGPAKRPVEVHWVEPKPAASAIAAGNPGASQPLANSPAVVTNSTHHPVKDPSLDRQALLAHLLQDIRSGNDPAMVKAMSAAALSLLDPDHQLDTADLAGLTPAQRDQVLHYQQATAAVARQIAAGKAGSADDLADQLSQAMDSQPVRMRSTQLCKKVSGYGIYDTFENNTFLAGREQPVIVYVELEHFRSAKDPEGQFQVKLSQEIVLYNEADGLAVWRQPTAEIVDRSRNKRHDFFVVQLVRLPARLTVGKYRLKVRVTDEQDSSIDESTVPLQVVADQAMVAK